MERRYYSFSEYLRNKFHARVRRISLNAGFGCPNRDGTFSDAGCIFCNEEGFANFPQDNLPLDRQIALSMESFKKRFRAEKFIAYFQNGTNTYGTADGLRRAFDVIKQFPDIVGLFISTRPDCIDGPKLDLIESYAGDYDVWIEYGVQSAHDRTLKAINRSHTFAQFLGALEDTSKRKIKTCAHIILGLPGESRRDMIETAKALSRLPLSGIKMHALCVLRDTELQRLYGRGSVQLLGEDEYAGLACDFLEHTNPDFVIMRLVSNAKKDALVAPGWVNEKEIVIGMIEKEFERRMTRQGIYCDNKDSRAAAVAL